MKFITALKSILGTFAGKALVVASLGLGGAIGAVFPNIQSVYNKDKMVFNFSTLSPKEQEQLKAKWLSEYLKVGDFLRHDDQPGDVHDLSGNEDLIIKKAVVNMLDELITRIRKVSPDARLVFSSGYRSRFRDIQVLGTGSGPHTKGNAVDVTFEIPNLSSREIARRVAAEAYKLGVKRIAIDHDGSYAVHLDPVTPVGPEGWYMEQERHQVEENGKKKWKNSYRPANPETWSSTQVAAAPRNLRRDSTDEVITYWAVPVPQPMNPDILVPITSPSVEPLVLSPAQPTLSRSPNGRDSGPCLSICQREHDICLKIITSDAEVFARNKYILDSCSGPYLACWKRCAGFPER